MIQAARMTHIFDHSTTSILTEFRRFTPARAREFLWATISGPQIFFFRAWDSSLSLRFRRSRNIVMLLLRSGFVSSKIDAVSTSFHLTMAVLWNFRSATRHGTAQRSTARPSRAEPGRVGDLRMILQLPHKPVRSFVCSTCILPYRSSWTVHFHVREKASVAAADLAIEEPIDSCFKSHPSLDSSLAVYSSATSKQSLVSFCGKLNSLPRTFKY